MNHKPIFASKDVIVLLDFDDTYKISDTRSKLRQAVNWVISPKSFAGMNGLVGSYVENGQKVIFLSNANETMRKRIINFLKTDGIDIGKIELILRPKSADKESYKIQEISKILTDNKTSKIILIGDNAQHYDMKAYLDIKKNFPQRVESIFIRQVRVDSFLPFGVKGFYTAFELALDGYYKGLLTRSQVLEIGESILNANNNLIIPKFSELPLNFKNSGNISDDLHVLRTKIIENINQIQISRDSCEKFFK